MHFDNLGGYVIGYCLFLQQCILLNTLLLIAFIVSLLEYLL